MVAIQVADCCIHGEYGGQTPGDVGEPVALPVPEQAQFSEPPDPDRLSLVRPSLPQARRSVQPSRS